MRTRQSARQSQKIDPKIIATSAVLQLSGMELTQKIDIELSDNPALEEDKERRCPNCDGLVNGNVCEHCGCRMYADEQSLREGLIWDQYSWHYDGVGTVYADETYDPLARIEDEVSLQQHLQLLLKSVIPAEDYRIGDYLINSVDDNGYLNCSTTELAEMLRLPVSRVEGVLHELQSLEPPGVGARTPQECLLLQLDYMEERGTGNPLARSIIESYFYQLGNHRYKEIARGLGVRMADVQKAGDFIRDNLNPYPGRLFHSTWSHQPPSRQSLTRPDVVIRRDDGQYLVEVVEGRDITLRINKFYRNLYLEMMADRSRFTPEERKHTAGYIERAELLIKNIHQRRQTIYDTTCCIVDYQKAFLESGNKLDLVPLTRTRVANSLGMDESTVSRALANKYAELPNHQITDYDIFFDASLSIKEIMREIIESEDRRNPVSDEEIKEKLCGMGHDIARRTVTKYREEMEVLSSNLRRRY